MRLEVANRARLIRPHEGAVTRDIGRKNRCQPTESFGLFRSFCHCRSSPLGGMHVSTVHPISRGPAGSTASAPTRKNASAGSSSHWLTLSLTVAGSQLLHTDQPMTGSSPIALARG